MLLFSRSVMSDFFWPHELQHARLPHPSPSPGVCSNSCPLSQWCHPTISSSVPLSPPVLSLSQYQGLFQWVGSSHQVAKVLELQLLASVHPMTIQGWFPLGLTCLISLLSRALSRVFSNTTIWKHQFCSTQSSWSNSHTHIYMTTGKTIALTIWPFVGKMMSLLFNMLSWFVIVFLPRNCALVQSKEWTFLA